VSGATPVDRIETNAQLEGTIGPQRRVPVIRGADS
jgi:hypothetical protein